MDIRVWKLSTIVLGAILLVCTVLLLVFGLRLSNINKIKAAELNSALKNQETKLNEDFQLEKETSSVKFVAEDVYGNFEFAYPKVWATNVRRSDSDPEMQFLADPETIIMRSDDGPKTAVRLVISKEHYEDKLKSIESDIESKNHGLKETDVTLSGLKGKKFTGKTEESEGKNISFVLLPFRDKSLYIGTDNFDKYSKQYEFVLKSFNLNK